MRSWDIRAVEAPDGVRTPTVLYSDDARAIVVCLEPGEELGDHEVRERAFVVVVQGEVDVRCHGGSLTAPSGTLLVFDPGERHSLSSADGARLLLVLAPWPAQGHYPDA